MSMSDIKNTILPIQAQARAAGNLAKGEFDALFNRGSRNSLAYNLIAEIGDSCYKIVEECDRILICLGMMEEMSEEMNKEMSDVNVR